MSRNNRKRGGRVRKKNPHKINREIRVPEVMLVGEGPDKEIMKTKEAIKKAENKGLDLVMVGAKADPPVCKIMDYNKFLYDKEKNKKPQKKTQLKEVRFRPTTDTHDFETKLKQIIKFLKKGHKVKAFVFFKGREMAFKDQGAKLLSDLVEELEEYGVPETMPKMEGRKMTIFFKPAKKK